MVSNTTKQSSLPNFTPLHLFQLYNPLLFALWGCSNSHGLLCHTEFLQLTLPFPSSLTPQVLSCDIDLLHPPAELEKRKHKLKRLVASPNSYFMDVKCQGCFNITTVFSHSQTVVVCSSCNAVLCVPTGGKARLMEGCSFRRKSD
jgi:small subunit ribosomal protein S27e